MNKKELIKEFLEEPTKIGDVTVPKTEVGDIGYTTTSTIEPPRPPKNRILREGEIPTK